jgi:hypothetical protein
LAIRFADLWAVDHHQMVDETYADAIHMESMARAGMVVEGIDELHALEDELVRRIPEHRHELVRVVVDAPRAFLETTVVGPTTGHFAQAALWWLVDGQGADGVGRVVHEVGWFDWEHRLTDSRRSRGTIPHDDGVDRGRAWYEALGRRLISAWNVDPLAAAHDHLPVAATVTWVGVDETTGDVAAARLAAHVGPAYEHPEIAVIDVIGEGAVVALLCTLTRGSRRTRFTAALTLDEADSIASLRLYFDWARAVDVATASPTA